MNSGELEGIYSKTSQNKTNKKSFLNAVDFIRRILIAAAQRHTDRRAAGSQVSVVRTLLAVAQMKVVFLIG